MCGFHTPMEVLVQFGFERADRRLVFIEPGWMMPCGCGQG